MPDPRYLSKTVRARFMRNLETDCAAMPESWWMPEPPPPTTDEIAAQRASKARERPQSLDPRGEG